MNNVDASLRNTTVIENGNDGYQGSYEGEDFWVGGLEKGELAK